MIAAGQVWRMTDATCQIGVVGKRLVHYKLFKGKPTLKAPALASLDALVKLLKEKKAVLVEG